MLKAYLCATYSCKYESGILVSIIIMLLEADVYQFDWSTITISFLWFVYILIYTHTHTHIPPLPILDDLFKDKTASHLQMASLR